MARLTSLSSPASPRSATAPPPAFLIIAAVSSTASARSKQITRAPSWAKRSALARPIPLAAPVTTVDRPSSRPTSGGRSGRGAGRQPRALQGVELAAHPGQGLGEDGLDGPALGFANRLDGAG